MCHCSQLVLWKKSKFSLYSWIAAAFPMSCTLKGMAFAPGLCCYLCSFLSRCFPLEQTFSRRRQAQHIHVSHFCSSHQHLSVVHDAHQEIQAVQNALYFQNQETTPPNFLLSLGKLEGFCIVSELVQAAPLSPLLNCSLQLLPPWPLMTCSHSKLPQYSCQKICCHYECIWRLMGIWAHPPQEGLCAPSQHTVSWEWLWLLGVWSKRHFHCSMKTTRDWISLLRNDLLIL